jgi:hypothetical protein
MLFFRFFDERVSVTEGIAVSGAEGYHWIWDE